MPKKVSVPEGFAAFRGPRRASGSGSWPPPRSGSRRRRGYSKEAFFCSAGLLVLGPCTLQVQTYFFRIMALAVDQHHCLKASSRVHDSWSTTIMLFGHSHFIFM